jgi:hypothetical protein
LKPTVSDDVEKLMNPLVTIIPMAYVDALLTLNGKLQGREVMWSVAGDLGETLRTVHVDPDCVEIVTSKSDAEKIFEAVQGYSPEEFKLVTETLTRKAIIGEKDYPISIRSYFFRFKIGLVQFKVYGDLQYRIADWDWGDKIEFTPDYIYVVGQKISVIPLQIKYDLYRGLGWTDRAEKIASVLYRRHHVGQKHIKMDESR